jgi:hypothetical protein
MDLVIHERQISLLTLENAPVSKSLNQLVKVVLAAAAVIPHVGFTLRMTEHDPEAGSLTPLHGAFFQQCCVDGVGIWMAGKAGILLERQAFTGAEDHGSIVLATRPRKAKPRQPPIQLNPTTPTENIGQSAMCSSSRT